MVNRKQLSLFFILLIAAPCAVIAGSQSETAAEGTDWPRFRGPSGNGRVPDEYLDLDSGLGSLKERWSVDVGSGYSAPSAAGGDVFAVGYDGGDDTLHCIDGRTGKIKWTYSYPSKAGGYTGPLSSPTVYDGAVYVLGKEGTLVKLNAVTGDLVWKRNIVDEYDVLPADWDIASSVVPFQDVLLINVRQSGMAVDSGTGDLVWASGTGLPGYATPVVAEINGRFTGLFFGAKALYGVDPYSGEVFWSFSWRTDFDVNAADPLVIGNSVFISSNYRRGCALIEISDDGPELVWETKAASSHFSSFVYHDGYIYGNDGDAGSHRGSFVCIDAGTGDVVWSERATMGSLISVGDKLLMLTERRELILAQMAADSYREVDRISLGAKGLYWTAPVVANGSVLVRSMTGTVTALGR